MHEAELPAFKELFRHPLLRFPDHVRGHAVVFDQRTGCEEGIFRRTAFAVVVDEKQGGDKVLEITYRDRTQPFRIRFRIREPELIRGDDV